MTFLLISAKAFKVCIVDIFHCLSRSLFFSLSRLVGISVTIMTCLFRKPTSIYLADGGRCALSFVYITRLNIRHSLPVLINLARKFFHLSSQSLIGHDDTAPIAACTYCRLSKPFVRRRHPRPCPPQQINSIPDFKNIIYYTACNTLTVIVCIGGSREIAKRLSFKRHLHASDVSFHYIVSV